MKLQLITGPNRTREVSLNEREVTLMLGESTGMNIGASIRHACQILDSKRGERVLYINTVQTVWKIADSIRRNVPNPEQYIADYYLPDNTKSDCIYFMTTDTGELHKEKEKILNFMKNNNVKTVIVNSWEFAAKNSRLREALLFIFRGLNNGDQNPHYKPDSKEYQPYFAADYQPATVIVYAEALSNTVLAGKINRGGFGKLAAIADQVVLMDSRTDFSPSEVSSTEFIPSEAAPATTTPKRTEVRSTIPVTSIEQLRTAPPAPERLERLPIHLNNFAPDKAPAPGSKIKLKSL